MDKVHCPECNSQEYYEATIYQSGGVTYMHCVSCGYEELVDCPEAYEPY